MSAIGWIEIPARDLERSAAFYEAVFGWEIDREGPFEGYFTFRYPTGESAGALTDQWEPASQPGVMIYIETDEIDDALARIIEQGGSTVQPKTLIDEDTGWWASFQDPAGNQVGLFQG
ncbi:MAG: VOC family protein [Actinomycetota bacterium]|nr:VOC family protein [Actinomycetota bacterium]